VETNGKPAPTARGFTALFSEQRRLWRNVLSFPQVAQAARDVRVGTTPHTVVLEQRTHRLLRYTRATPATQAEPILFCYALINRPYILDLQPDKSVVRRYLERGFDVYMIDWGVPTHADRTLSLHDYVCGFLDKSVDTIRRENDRKPVHLLGYCMGGTLSALYTALDPGAVKTLTLLAAPIDFAPTETLLNLWTQGGAFDVDALLDAYGNCPAWFLQSIFLFMNPIRNVFDKTIAFWEQMSDPDKVSSTLALERWLNDNIPVAGATFRQFVHNLYQRNELVRGELRVGSRRVDLSRVTCPLLLLTATNDHLVAPASTEGIRRHVGSRDVTSMPIDAGHVGLVVGGKAHAKVWPQATRWAAERSTPVATAATPLATVATPPTAARGAAVTETISTPAPKGPRRPAKNEPRWWAQTR
jgi:polyhydroxyalkanoate synthase